MSTFKVPLTIIKDITPHPNPEVLRLEIAHIYGFRVVVSKGMYSIGDQVVYVPIDSVLPKELESQLFPEGSKIKLNGSRIRQIRIQKFPSQGMLINTSDISNLTDLSKIELETDLSALLGITKYEPPAPSWQTPTQQTSKKKLENKSFVKYNGLENIKWYDGLFKEDEEVVIQEKLHGSLCRAGYLPTVLLTFTDVIYLLKTVPSSKNKPRIMKQCLEMMVKVIKGKLGLLPEYEFCYGSNNVELTNRIGYSGFYETDIYKDVLLKVNAKDKLKQDEVIYGELIGEGIQKNYSYGHKKHHFVLFDVLVNGKWLNPEEVEEYAKERGFDHVPILYKGLYDKLKAYELTKGDSVYCKSQKIREGIVIKSRLKYNDELCPSNKKALKFISEEYLDKNNTDFH